MKFGKFPGGKGERISKGLIRKLLPARPIIIDCGAHDGRDSVELCRMYDASVHAFEPVPALFGRLKQEAGAHDRIHCYELAVGDADGNIDFFVSGGSSDASSSILAPKEHLNDHPDVVFNERIRVNCLTLDSWAEQNAIDHVDLLWLDMQGLEMQMLNASPRMLAKVTAIHTEVSTRETYSGVRLYPELREWLLSRGFKVAVEAIPKDWDMGNVHFVRA